VLAADLVNELVASQSRNTLARRLAAWAAPDLLLSITGKSKRSDEEVE
jgi:hypothetical protein